METNRRFVVIHNPPDSDIGKHVTRLLEQNNKRLPLAELATLERSGLRMSVLKEEDNLFKHYKCKGEMNYQLDGSYVVDK